MIFADFNNADSEGRLRLNCKGTIEDLAALGRKLVAGERYIFCDGELKVEGLVVISSEGIWAAEIDWDAIQSITSSDSTGG